MVSRAPVVPQRQNCTYGIKSDSHSPSPPAPRATAAQRSATTPQHATPTPSTQLRQSGKLFLSRSAAQRPKYAATSGVLQVVSPAE